MRVRICAHRSHNYFSPPHGLLQPVADAVKLLSKEPRLENLWVPPVSWKYERHSNRIGKPRCFNGLQVALNMLRPAFWSPAEPAWDFEVTPLLVPKALFRGGAWLATGVPSVITSKPANEELARTGTSAAKQFHALGACLVSF